MRIIIFSHQYGHGKHNSYQEEMEFEDDVTDEDISKEYQDWVWERIGDSFSWYDKED